MNLKLLVFICTEALTRNIEFHEGIYAGQWQFQRDLHDANHLNLLPSCVLSIVDPLTKLESVNESSELVKLIK